MLFADDLVLLFKAEISKIFIQCQIQFSRKWLNGLLLII